MKLEFKNIIDKHKDNSALCIAHGPSLNSYLDKLSDIKSKGFILYGCNEWFDFYNEKPNYWIKANNFNNLKVQNNIMNEKNIPVLYADSVDTTDRKWIEDNLKCDYLPYDQRNFDNKPAGVSQADHFFIKDRKTIQEELQDYTGYKEHYGSGDTVLVHLISFAILMGCNPIYITGADLNYKLGYAKCKIKKTVYTPNMFFELQHRIFKDINIIKESANNIGTKIFNLDENSRFDLFEKARLCLKK